jgi:hypothetical protein
LQQRRVLRSQLFIELQGLLELGGDLRDVHDADIVHVTHHRNRDGLKKSLSFFSPSGAGTADASLLGISCTHRPTGGCHCVGRRGVDT